MLNLLPQEEKKRLISDYYVRFAIVVTSFVCALFVIAIVGLFPAYINERSETNNAIEQKMKAEQNHSEALEGELSEQVAHNEVIGSDLASRVELLETQPPVSMLIENIFKIRSSAITIESVSVAQNTIIISGVAATRGDLISFRDALRRDRYFASAILPIADLAKSVDAEFTIQITLPSS